MIRESYLHENRERYILRFFYDVSFFFIINIVLMNIIFGIIIDAFKELRTKNFATDEDMRDVCFICSLNRHQFENNEGGFSKHRKVDHNVWNYVFYLYDLKNKSNTDFSGIESYVQDMVKEDNHFWIPIEQSISLSITKQQEEEESIDNRLNEIKQAALRFERVVDEMLELKNRELAEANISGNY